MPANLGNTPVKNSLSKKMTRIPNKFHCFRVKGEYLSDLTLRQIKAKKERKDGRANLIKFNKYRLEDKYTFDSPSSRSFRMSTWMRSPQRRLKISFPTTAQENIIMDALPSLKHLKNLRILNVKKDSFFKLIPRIKCLKQLVLTTIGS